MAELLGLSFKTTVNLHAPAWPTTMTTVSGHRCTSPTLASTSALSPRLLPRSIKSTLSASQPASSTITNAASSMITYPAHLATKAQEELQRPSYKNSNVPSLPLTVKAFDE
eukprot:3318087-Pleurochrysis_carterae.AAC.1